MKHDYRYLILKRAIQDWFMDKGTLLSIALALGVDRDYLHNILEKGGLSDAAGLPAVDADPQDVINLVLLSFTFQKYYPTMPAEYKHHRS